MRPKKASKSADSAAKRGRPRNDEAKKLAYKQRKIELQRLRRAAQKASTTWAAAGPSARREMVRDLVDVQGLDPLQAADRLDVSHSTLDRWYREATGKRLTPEADPLQMTDAQIAELQQRKLAEMLRQRQLRQLGSAIPPLHPVGRPDIRRLCERDLALFAQHYFPSSTGQGPLGPPQLFLLDRLERSTTSPCRFLSVLSRGFIKTSASLAALIHAAVYGRSLFSIFLAANSEFANLAAEAIKTELATNQLLFRDFPEVCIPIRDLQGKPQRAAGQNHNGKLTMIEMTADTIIMPTIEGSQASGAIIKFLGLEQASRGLYHKRADGVTVRPRLVILDDPQTEKSAASPSMTRAKLNIIRRSLQRLGSHGNRCSIVINGTPLVPGDLIEQMGNRRAFPGWTQVRTPMFSTMPPDEILRVHWFGEYQRLLTTYDERDIEAEENAAKAATAYYIANREEMDALFDPAWPSIPLERNEISAIQHGMNIAILEGWDIFMSECQLQPLTASDLAVDAQQLLTRWSGFARGVVPQSCNHLSFGIDVHDEILYWVLLALENDFTGYVVDFGTYPEQPLSYFTRDTVKKTLEDLYGQAPELNIELGIEDLISHLCRRSWPDQNGEPRSITAGLIDAGYKPTEVLNAIRKSKIPNIYTSRGVGIGPLRKAMPDYDTSDKKILKAGPDRLRPRWIMPTDGKDGDILRVDFDKYYWCDVVQARLTQDCNQARWTLPDGDLSMIADHLTCEAPTAVTAGGKTVNVWGYKGSSRENHYWDSAIMAAVAGSISGAVVPGFVPRPSNEKQIVRGSDLQKLRLRK